MGLFSQSTIPPLRLAVTFDDGVRGDDGRHLSPRSLLSLASSMIASPLRASTAPTGGAAPIMIAPASEE